MAAAAASLACAVHGGATVGQESIALPPSEELRLAMPLSTYDPPTVPTTQSDVQPAVQPSEPLPTPPQDVPTESSELRFTEPSEPYRTYELPSTDGCETYNDDGLFSERFTAEQYPDNWLWGAGGSPYRTGPGNCDDWKVGPVWDVAVDGMTLFRDEADLAALEMAVGSMDDPRENNFGYSGGARVWAMGKLPRWEKYQIQFGYEGIDEWNAALLYPTMPVGDMDDMIEENRSLHYRSSLHSAEFNFFRKTDPILRPFWGFRYLRFTDEIADMTDQSAPFPLPVDFPMPPAVVTTVDQLNYIDIKNNLIGFQVGLREDLWHLNRRVSLQGFVNGGVYYNHIQFASGDVESQTVLASAVLDDPLTGDANEAIAGTTTTTTSGLVSSSEPSDIAYVVEASITAVCRLNRCLALRGGYQMFWVEGLALAEDAYLDLPLGRHNFLMQGWHVGIEYRR